MLFLLLFQYTEHRVTYTLICVLILYPVLLSSSQIELPYCRKIWDSHFQNCPQLQEFAISLCYLLGRGVITVLKVIQQISGDVEHSL